MQLFLIAPPTTEKIDSKVKKLEILKILKIEVREKNDTIKRFEVNSLKFYF